MYSAFNFYNYIYLFSLSDSALFLKCITSIFFIYYKKGLFFIFLVTLCYSLTKYA